MLEPSATYRTPFSFANAMIFFEQFMLAQVAAVLGIVGETLDLQFLRLHNKVTDSFAFAERRCLVQLPLGKNSSARSRQ